jgi:hypothetical protein
MPVEVQRTGQRAIAFGGAERRPAGPAFPVGQQRHQGRGQRRHLRTRRVYPPGLPVGKHRARLEAPGTSGIFGSVLIAPTAAIDRSRLMLVLLVDPRHCRLRPAEAPADNRKRKPKSDPS